MSRSQTAKGMLCAEAARPAPRNPLRSFLAWVADARSHRVICLVAALWVLNAFDLVLTITAYQQRLLHELNPVAARMLVEGEVFLVLYKFGLLAIASYPLLKFRRERIVELGAVLVLIIYALVAVHWQDCYDFYTQTVITTPDEGLLDPFTQVEPD